MQEAASLIIGAEADTLASLEHRRRVGALTNCTSFSHGMHPKNCGRGFRRNWKGRRAAALECLRESTTLRTRINFSRCLPVSAPITSREAFLFALSRSGTDYRRTSLQTASILLVQSFNCKVNNFLRSQPNPLRGEAA